MAKRAPARRPANPSKTASSEAAPGSESAESAESTPPRAADPAPEVEALRAEHERLVSALRGQQLQQVDALSREHEQLVAKLRAELRDAQAKIETLGHELARAQQEHRSAVSQLQTGLESEQRRADGLAASLRETETNLLMRLGRRLERYPRLKLAVRQLTERLGL
ncbi:MAG: hypothetical protein U1A78_29495 [Polyangia bacterium]